MNLFVHIIASELFTIKLECLQVYMEMHLIYIDIH